MAFNKKILLVVSLLLCFYLLTTLSNLARQLFFLPTSLWEPSSPHKSEYELKQGSKLYEHSWADRIKVIDVNKIEPQLTLRFANSAKQHKFEVKAKPVLCVGARLGGEVRAFTNLGALAIGIDFNPGPNNKFVLYGSATKFQFASDTFNFLYSNILDHIDDFESFLRECKRVLFVEDSYIFLDVDQNAPDKWSTRDMRGQIGNISQWVETFGFKLLSDQIIRNEKDRGKHALIFKVAVSPPSKLS
jgi:SAM-dependent methyltransferase